MFVFVHISLMHNYQEQVFKNDLGSVTFFNLPLDYGRWVSSIYQIFCLLALDTSIFSKLLTVENCDKECGSPSHLAHTEITFVILWHI